MKENKLIVCIVPQDAGEKITGASVKAGAAGGTIIRGRGTASSVILQVLGLGDRSKDIAFILTDSEALETQRAAIIGATNAQKSHYGIMFTIDVSYLMKAGVLSGGENSMNHEITHEMITVIANRGYADDIMAAARKAGAGGGTIINARGTAKDGDVKFFGIEIVPEKDMLMIIVEKEKVEPIMSAVKELPCLQKKGSGIVFASPACQFTLLGKDK